MGRISINSEIQVISETVSQIGWFPYMEDETTLAVLFHDTDNQKNWKVTLDLENFSLSEPQIIQEELDPPGGTAGRPEFAEFAFPDLDGSQYGSDAYFYHVINALKYEATLNDQVIATVSRVFLDQRLGETREDMVLRELGYIPKDQYGTDTYFRDFFKIDWGDSYSFVDIVPLDVARLHAVPILCTDF